MESSYIKLIETIIVIAAYAILRGLSFRLINKTVVEKLVQRLRGVLMKKLLNLLLLLLAVIFIVIIWGVKQSDLTLFVGSVLTVIGVALFAQWSILSNITSSAIIFFYHSVKLDDEIIIMEGKEYEIEGRVVEIGLFFVTLLTKDSEELTLPNNVFIQKSIRKKGGSEPERSL